MNKEYENVIYFYRNWWHQLIFETRVYNIQNFSKMLISFFSLLADYLSQMKILILIRFIKNFKLTLCSSIFSVQRQFIHWLLFSRGFRRWWADLLSLVLQRSKIYFWRPAARAYNSNDSEHTQHATLCQSLSRTLPRIRFDHFPRTHRAATGAYWNIIFVIHWGTSPTISRQWQRICNW